ncbi:MAG: hypothetical protein PHR77_02550 [Kiritimatiellae bacterium]|nr:hypothetical protein [Kiritimatiellia bacterium]MDD5523367.1 hypothetical protein [Kiritimatiellia bacterium]
MKTVGMLYGVLILCWLMAPANAEQVKLKEDTKQLVEAVKNFRLEAVLTPIDALKKNSSADGLADLTRVEDAFFDEMPQSVAWSAFFSSSVYAVAPLNDQTHVVLFYHPWSDTALMTNWESKGKRFLMIQAKLLLGDYLRQFGKPPFDAQPAWERDTAALTPLLTLPMAVGETLCAFESIYPLSGILPAGSLVSAQRKQFEDNFGNVDVVQVLQSVANIRFERSVAALVRFENDDAFKTYKELTYMIFRNIREGNMQDIEVTLPMTNPETFNLIKENAVTIGAQFKVVSVAKTKNDCFIFLLHVADPNNVLAFWFQTDKKKFGLRQATFMNHIFSASSLDQIKELVEIARKQK